MVTYIYLQKGPLQGVNKDSLQVPRMQRMK